MDIAALRTFLLGVLGLPLIGGLIVLLLGGSYKLSRSLALVFTLVHLSLTAALLIPAGKLLTNPEQHSHETNNGFRVMVPEIVPGATTETPQQTTWDILPVEVSATTMDRASTGVQFFIGLDGINFWLVALASVMMPVVVLSTWSSITDRANQFYGWLLVLQSATIGVFLALDIVLFYVFFELTLIPIFFLIGIWGVGPGRREAARKFFLYTLAGSLITLVGVIAAVLLVYFNTAPHVLTFSLPELVTQLQALYSQSDVEKQVYWQSVQSYLFIALVLGFAVKIPLVPVHSWLPTAYSEAPMSVTIFLSSLLAKLGTYGLVRIVLPLAPDAAITGGLSLIGTLATIGIIYGAFCAYAQSDLKKMIAYSSISHLGFCALALAAFNAEGLQGGVLHMVNHGVATGALFLLAGFLFDRYHTQQIDDYSGLMNLLPAMSFFMVVICLANIGIPGLNNFVSEMIMLGALFELSEEQNISIGYAVFAAFGILMGAWYILTMLQRMFFGPLREPPRPAETIVRGGLNLREWFAILPLTGLCLALGLFPRPVLEVMQPDTQALATLAETARARHDFSANNAD